MRSKKGHPKALWVSTYPKQVQEGQRERKDREQRLYQQEARQFKKEHPWCQCCPLLRMGKAVRRTKDIHHLRGRLGPLLRDKRYWMSACRPCHDFLHANPQAARNWGMMANTGQWNKGPKV